MILLSLHPHPDLDMIQTPHLCLFESLVEVSLKYSFLTPAAGEMLDSGTVTCSSPILSIEKVLIIH